MARIRRGRSRPDLGVAAVDVVEPALDHDQVGAGRGSGGAVGVDTGPQPLARRLKPSRRSHRRAPGPAAATARTRPAGRGRGRRSRSHRDRDPRAGAGAGVGGGPAGRGAGGPRAPVGVVAAARSERWRVIEATTTAAAVAAGSDRRICAPPPRRTDQQRLPAGPPGVLGFTGTARVGSTGQSLTIIGVKSAFGPIASAAPRKGRVRSGDGVRRQLAREVLVDPAGDAGCRRRCARSSRSRRAGAPG